MTTWNDLSLLSTNALQMGTTTLSAVYTPPANKKVQIYSIDLFNLNTSSETILLYVHGTNAGNQFFNEGLGAVSHREYFQKGPICMDGTDSNDKIVGSTTTAAKVNVRIYGKRET